MPAQHMCFRETKMMKQNIHKGVTTPDPDKIKTTVMTCRYTYICFLLFIIEK